ncbi:Transcription initiation factor TFIID subunit 5 [Plasmodiophora brassicae]|uniref:TFIID subunit TAF5 NTD2 domain-containing protein n=1 Tax=Plasmodiophora brassicae TaxID=37360 RepID=A0A0G4IMA9_PLABS|nr:hypothetical protein PBRA_005052 [Plasmodiophora brassicae]
MAERGGLVPAAASQSASSLTDEMIDKFVLSYLRSRGYARAEDVFRQQLHADGLDQFAHSVSVECHATTVQQILQGYNQQQQSPDWYAEAFQALQDWVEGSLDKYRLELHAVLFPVFLHCYFELILKGFPYDAHTFMERFRREFETRQSREIQSVTGLQYPEQLDGNATAKRFRTYKVDVVLSSYSHQLLMSFLQETKLYLLLKIINEHINLSIMTAKPLTSAEIGGGKEAGTSEITGLTPSEIETMNSREVEWGLLKSVTDIIADETAAISKTEASGGQPDSGQDRADMDIVGGPEDVSSLAKKAKSGDEPPPRTAESRIPLPPVTPALKQKIIDDLHARLNILPAVTMKPSVCCYTFLNSAETLNRIHISRDAATVCGGYSDSSIKVWTLDGKSKGSSLPASKPYRSLIGHAGPVFSIDMSRDMRFVLSSSEDGTVRLWSLSEMLGLVSYRGHNYPVWDVKFSPLDFYFVSASHDRTARLWSTEHIFPLRIFTGHISDVDCVAFHPNCNYVLTGSTDKSIRFWDIQSGECCRIFRGSNAYIRSVSVSPCGRVAAAGDSAGQVSLFDLGSAQVIARFDGHSQAVTCLDWSASGKQLASGSLDSSVRVWNVSTPDRNAQARAPISTANAPAHVFHTKSTPISFLRYSPSDLLLAGGVFRPV